MGGTGVDLRPDEDEPANRRKPRMYSSFQQLSPANPYPLDFCLWLQRNFDFLLEQFELERKEHETNSWISRLRQE